jgi:hypothetical protein
MAKPEVRTEIESKEIESKVNKKKMMTLFFLMTPSLLIAMASAISDLVIRFGFLVVLLFFHFVIFKNFLDTYMGED